MSHTHSAYPGVLSLMSNSLFSTTTEILRFEGVDRAAYWRKFSLLLSLAVIIFSACFVYIFLGPRERLFRKAEQGVKFTPGKPASVAFLAVVLGPPLAATYLHYIESGTEAVQAQRTRE
ncbi:hypothetical protein [Roseibium sp. M-1]